MMAGKVRESALAIALFESIVIPWQHIKQFLLLSKRRTMLISQCLKDSETSKPNFMPRLYINRRLAMEHRDNPALDPSCKNTVFTQVRGNNVIACPSPLWDPPGVLR